MLQQLINQIYMILNELLMLPFKLLTEIFDTFSTIWLIIFPYPEPDQTEETTVEETEQPEYHDPVKVEGFRQEGRETK